MLSFFALTIGLHASTLTVTSDADSGPGSLRQATLDALPGDSIVIAPSVTTTIFLVSELTIENRVSIRGGGAARTVINGSNSTRLFNVAPTGNLTLSHLSLVAGRVVNADGGAILNAGNVVIDDVVFDANAVASPTIDTHGGGAIANGGTMSIERSWFENNIVTGGPGPRVGGAIWNYGTMTIGDSSFWLNSTCCTGASGGAIAAGISLAGSTTAIERSTIVHNDIVQYEGPMNGAGVFALFATVTLHNSVVVNNATAQSGMSTYDNLSGVGTLGHNVVGKSQTPLPPASGDQVNLSDQSSSSWFATDPLANTPDGGMFTPALNGPLVNTGDGTGAPPTDQAGNRRFIACAMDVGAVELQPLPTTMTLTLPITVERRTTFDVEADLASNARCPVTGVVEFFVDGDSVATVAPTNNIAIATLNIYLTGDHTVRAVLHSTDYAAAEKTAGLTVVNYIPALSPAMLLLLALSLAAASAFVIKRA